MLKYDWLKIAEMHVFARSLRHGGYAGELDILKLELLLKVNVHGKPVNCNRVHRRLFAGRKSTAAALADKTAVGRGHRKQRKIMHT